MAEHRGILSTRLKSMGDVIFTLPAVHALRLAFPESPITFLVSRESAPLLEGFRDVNAVIALDRGRLCRANPLACLRELSGLLWQLRRGRFRLAVDFQGYGETALLTWFSGAPERWGTVYRAGSVWAYTRPVPRHCRLHPAEACLALLREAGLPPTAVQNEFVLPDRALAQAKQFLRENGLDPARPTVFLQPFTSSPQKNWPLERFLEAARAWTLQGRQVLFGGGPAERSALDAARQAGFCVAAGVPLMVSAGLVKLSNGVVGGDTGLLHLAVAMGKRVVMLMGAAGPGATCPFGHPEWALLPPQGQPVASIPVEAVLRSCAEAFASCAG